MYSTEYDISNLINIFQDEHEIEIAESENMKTFKCYNIVITDRLDNIKLERTNQVYAYSQS